MIINPIELIENESNLILSSLIEYSRKKERLWYSFEKKYLKYLTIEKLDGFVVGVLPLAMYLGEDIVVQGTLSEKLYHSLTNYYMYIVQLAVPEYKPVKIIPTYLNSGHTSPCENKVGTGFSAGIDSFFTVLKYLREDNVLANYKISHFFFCNVGSFGAPQKSRQLFHSRYNLLKRFPESMGKEYVKIDSNLDDILGLPFEKTHQMRTLSCSLMMQKLLGKYYVSSGYSYKDSFIGKSDHIESTDPAAVHLLSTETLEFILSGAQVSRFEKTRQIAVSGIANRWLNVCTMFSEDGKNCSTCTKCCRTLFSLELLGSIEKFAEVFNLDKWRKARNRYIITMILRNGDPLARELKENAQAVGYKFPLWQKAAALLLSLSVLRRIARRVLTKLFPEYIRVG